MVASVRSPYKYLRVWPEFVSSGIWTLDEPFQQTAGKMLDYSFLALPNDLVRQFMDWQDWYEEWPDQLKTFDWDQFNARGLILARRLNRFLGREQHVEYQGTKIELDDLEVDDIVLPKQFKEPAFANDPRKHTVVCLDSVKVEQLKKTHVLAGKGLEGREADGDITPGICLVIAADVLMNSIDQAIGTGLKEVLATTYLGRFSGERDGILTLANPSNLNEFLERYAETQLAIPQRGLADVLDEFGPTFPTGDFCGKYRDCDCGEPACGCWFVWMKGGICLFYMEINGTWVHDVRLFPFQTSKDQEMTSPAA